MYSCINAISYTYIYIHIYIIHTYNMYMQLQFCETTEPLIELKGGGSGGWLYVYVYTTFGRISTSFSRAL